jgi:hypothetical protein
MRQVGYIQGSLEHQFEDKHKKQVKKDEQASVVPREENSHLPKRQNWEYTILHRMQLWDRKLRKTVTVSLFMKVLRSKTVRNVNTVSK